MTNLNLWGNEMIRNIKKEDAKSIREICDVSLGYIVSTKLVEKQIAKLSHDKNHHLIYVYEDEDSHKVVGFIHAEIYESLYSDCGLNILGLAVLPEFQGRCIGKKLINHLELKQLNNIFNRKEKKISDTSIKMKLKQYNISSQE